MNNLDKILGNTRGRGYHCLAGTKITPKWADIPHAFMQYCTTYTKNHYLIEVNGHLMRNAPVEVVTGAFAHELAHISDELRRGFIVRGICNLLYTASKKYRSFDERNTDVRAIFEGFGPEIIKLAEYAKNNPAKKGTEFTMCADGITIEEARKVVEYLKEHPINIKTHSLITPYALRTKVGI